MNSFFFPLQVGWVTHLQKKKKKKVGWVMQGHYQIIKSGNVSVEFFSLFQSTSHHWGFLLTRATNTQNVSYTPINFLKYKFIIN
jgi:hypothetical protein